MTPDRSLVVIIAACPQWVIHRVFLERHDPGCTQDCRQARASLLRFHVRELLEAGKDRGILAGLWSGLLTCKPAALIAFTRRKRVGFIGSTIPASFAPSPLSAALQPTKPE
ncbi:hypothetical protein [Qipengyuania pelagi]|jgi:hypothetical protein|nr:hypothetical protein [Qipengyuania pelagi]